MTYKAIINLLVAITLTVTAIPLFGATAPQLKQIVIFGDSYSDNGNTYAASKNTYPGQAYYLGHFLDGLNWAEYFSSSLGIDFTNPKLFQDYAYGQAQTIGKITLTTYSPINKQMKWKFTIPDLSDEINQYIKNDNISPSHSIYFIFIGTNDFLNYIPKSKKQNQQFVKNEFNELEKQVLRLQQLGQVRIVIFNIRDLKLSPLAKQLGVKYQKDYINTLNNMIVDYNSLLAKKYTNSKNILIYDTYSFDDHIMKNNIRYQWSKQFFVLTEKSTPCYINKGNYIEQVSTICLNPQNYFFYDRIHQTTFVNKLMTDDLLIFLAKNKWEFKS